MLQAKKSKKLLKKLVQISKQGTDVAEKNVKSLKIAMQAEGKVIKQASSLARGLLTKKQSHRPLIPMPSPHSHATPALMPVPTPSSKPHLFRPGTVNVSHSIDHAIHVVLLLPPTICTASHGVCTADLWAEGGAVGPQICGANNNRVPAE